MPLNADEIQSIKNLIIDPISARIDDLRNEIREIHTPEDCVKAKELTIALDLTKDEVKKMWGQQKFWLGGIAVIAALLSRIDTVITWLRK